MGVSLVKFLSKKRKKNLYVQTPKRQNENKIPKKKKKEEEEKIALAVHAGSYDQVQLWRAWSWNKHQTSAKGWGRDQAAELGLRSGRRFSSPRKQQEHGERPAPLRPTQMTTPLHALKGPFKVPSAPEAKVRFNNNYLNFLKKIYPNH